MKKPASIIRWIPLALLGGAMLGAGLLWRFSPLAEWVTPARIDGVMSTVSASAWWPFLVIGVYIIAGLIAFPLTLLVITTAIVFGPLGAFVCALIGSTSSAVIAFWLGSVMGRQRLVEIFGERVERIARATEQRGILAIAVLRNLPVAPFVVMNFAVGALGIRLKTFVLGSLLGIAPGIGLLCLMGDRLRIILANPQPTHIAVVAGVAVAWLSLALAFQARFGKRAGMPKHALAKTES